MNRQQGHLNIERVIEQFPPMQHPEEFLWMWDRLPQLVSVLETGMGWGGTAALFSITGARIVTVDPKPEEVWAWKTKQFRMVYSQPDVHWINLSSLDDRVPALATELNDGRRFTLLHIDGDHSVEGCYHDWNTYQGMADWVAIHDIFGWDNPMHDKIAWGPRKLWDELVREGQYQVEWFCNRQDGGIGLVKMFS